VSATRRRSLFWTLTASIVAVLVLTAVLQVLVAVLVVEPIARGRERDQAQDLLDGIATELEGVALDSGPEAIAPILRRYQRAAQGMIVVFVPTDRPPILPFAPGRRMRGALQPGRPHAIDPERIRAGDLPVIATQPVEHDGERVGELQVWRARPGLAFTQWLPVRWFMLFPVSLIAAALGGMWIFRRLQRRLNRLGDHARAVGEGDLDARIENPGEDEIGQLAHQLNAMTGKLAQAREQVESMEGERKRLLADITHELSTPLTSVRGYAETLLDDKVPLDAPTRARFLEDILRASERMQWLIDDLLDLSRLEAGASDLQLEDIDLAALVRHTVDRHRPRFEAARIGLTGPVDAGTMVAHIDGRRLEQVVENLLANALKHVPAGGRVEVELRSAPGEIVLSVADDGPGFPPDALPHVFDRFYRADSSRTTPGTGLGLAIVKEIVVRHGGRVRAENGPSGGAVLTVILPASA
jgi:signal transduction histidine kinase